VIEQGWRTEVEGAERDELSRLLTEAAGHDGEDGFATFGLDDPVPPGTRYLLVWLLPDERTGREQPAPELAGCLRLEPDAGTPGRAEARMVVHPALRARGVTTLLLERVGLDLAADGGWCGTGVRELRCWAVGDHPAAQRVWLRLRHRGVHPARREWHLVIPFHRADLEGVAGRPLPDGIEDELHAHAGEPGYDTRARLSAALDKLRADGADGGALTVDEGEDDLLAACRVLGFQHARTDVRYDAP
jgi:hypothetical protein